MLRLIIQSGGESVWWKVPLWTALLGQTANGCLIYSERMFSALMVLGFIPHWGASWLFLINNLFLHNIDVVSTLKFKSTICPFSDSLGERKRARIAAVTFWASGALMRSWHLITSKLPLQKYPMMPLSTVLQIPASNSLQFHLLLQLGDFERRSTCKV